jgi:hypothetical protein
MKTMNLTLMLLLFVACSFAQNVPSYVPSNGLVGWWPFNGNASDESGNGNNGTVNGATLTSDRFGNTGKAYDFDGVDDVIATTLIQGSISTYSISCWINTSSTSLNACSGGGAIVQSRGPALQTTGKTFMIFYGENAIPKITSAINGESLIFGKQSVNDVNDGLWHHIVGTWSGVSGTNLALNEVKLYVDGTEITNASNSFFDPNGPTQAPINSPYNTKFGVFEGCIASKFFEGKIDDIGIWNRALDSSEVVALYNSNTSTTVTLNNQSNKIKIHPNPTNDHITIDAGDLNVMNGYSIRIVNALGQQMFQSAITQQQFYLDLSTWTGSGIYYVNIINAQGVTIDTRKIVLQ